MSAVASHQAAVPQALRLAAEHTRTMARSVVLYAGTNQASPAVEAALASSIGGMPAMGRPWAKDQPGTAAISALEDLVEGQLRGLFGASWAEARLPSATMANLALYRAFCGPDRPLMANARRDLGHASHAQDGTPGLLGLRVVATPFERDGMTVDEDAAMAVVSACTPGLLMLGSTLVLHGRYPERLVAHARSLGTVVAYDASHVAGLIVGGSMRSPFAAGIQIVTASTYKSFGGPPGGILVGIDDSHAAALRPIVCPALTSNYDAARLVALSLACTDAEACMTAYARRMVWTADLLHAALTSAGLAPADRPRASGTHHLLLPIGDEAQARHAMATLEQCNILAGTQRVPGGDGRFGLRLGTQVIARKLYDSPAIEALASLIGSVLTNGPSERAASAATELALSFRTVSFCVDNPPRPAATPTGEEPHAP